jgi:hypothetical protein
MFSNILRSASNPAILSWCCMMVKLICTIGAWIEVDRGAVEVELGTRMDVVGIEVAMELSGTAIENIEDISKTGAADALLLAKGLFV